MAQAKHLKSLLGEDTLEALQNLRDTGQMFPLACNAKIAVSRAALVRALFSHELVEHVIVANLAKQPSITAKGYAFLRRHERKYKTQPELTPNDR